MARKEYKIYTRGGDRGKTSLVNGDRVAKADRRIEACGELDELNAHLGLLLTFSLSDEDRALLCDAQNRLFDFGVYVASVPKRICEFYELGHSIEELEQAIDIIQQQTVMPQGFILPGGVPAAAQCHVCRTVCRRVERRLCALQDVSLYESGLLPYMNRLSDYLYVLSLKINFKSRYMENLWQKRCRFEK